MTQKELADAAHINRVTLARIEAGQAQPYPSTIRRLATVLGVEPEQLMAPSEEGE